MGHNFGSPQILVGDNLLTMSFCLYEKLYLWAITRESVANYVQFRANPRPQTILLHSIIPAPDLPSHCPELSFYCTLKRRMCWTKQEKIKTSISFSDSRQPCAIFVGGKNNNHNSPSKNLLQGLLCQDLVRS